MDSNTRRRPRRLELLAPARNADIAIAAIDHGADAIYMGATHHGARHSASNSIADIARVVEYAHRFNVRIYVTLNTLVYDNELDEVEGLVDQLYRAGVDALIVQDMALLRMKLPPIALHASTQCDIRTPQRARFLQDAGFSQLVLARELTLSEIADIRRVTDVPLEAFVHGALCVSYSGNCQASYMLTGRSANRGECAQMCRLSYDLIDGDGNRVMTGKHLLSLRDMNRLAMLEDMIDAGIDSFKIEGRLKDIDYVKTVVSAYRQQLDSIIASRPDEFIRSSTGKSTITFTPRLDESFNRGYTDYFLRHRRPQVKMASFDTPKSIGNPIGTVRKVTGKTIIISTDTVINNGDGLTFLDPDGNLKGFRVNRAEGNRLFLNTPVDIRPGTTLYRNHNADREAMMLKSTATRTIDVDMTLRRASGTTIALDINPVGNPRLTATASVTLDTLGPARSPQAPARLATLSKLGGTAYTLNSLDDLLGDTFVPLSVLTSLRRGAVQALSRATGAAYRYEYRRTAPAEAPQLTDTRLQYDNNVANKLSAMFYRQAGATSIEPALETGLHRHTPTRVMLTRYCLRRELGHCLRTPAGTTLKAPLTLRGANFSLDLEFDCDKCEMSVFTSTRRPRRQ